MKWRKTVEIKKFLTSDESWEGVQEVANNIADALQKHYEFVYLLPLLRDIPKDNDTFKSVDYLNKILNMLYDIADNENIWVN